MAEETMSAADEDAELEDARHAAASTPSLVGDGTYEEAYSHSPVLMHHTGQLYLGKAHRRGTRIKYERNTPV